MNPSQVVVILALVMACLNPVARAQETSAPQQQSPESPPPGVAVVMPTPPPTTKLEATERTLWTVIVRGYTDVAGLRSDDGATVRVLAVALSDARQKVPMAVGVGVEVHPARRSDREVLAFVDEDEIAGLIDGIDSLTKLGHDPAGLASYEARYRTRGSLEVANVEINGARFLTVTTSQIVPSNGQLIWATATFPLARAHELQQQLTAARQVLDRTKPTTAP